MESCLEVGPGVGRVLSRLEAQRVLDAAVRAAEELGGPMNVAVVDAAGHLRTFLRMDGALLASIDLAQDKAYTALMFEQTTRDLARKVQPGQPLFGITRDRFVPIAGGVPLRGMGGIVGAIGVSSGTIEEDEAIAEAGAAALQPPKGP
jgi:uncharacterized protein GlcG (DUF336 family)